MQASNLTRENRWVLVMKSLRLSINPPTSEGKIRKEAWSESVTFKQVWEGPG